MRPASPPGGPDSAAHQEPSVCLRDPAPAARCVYLNNAATSYPKPSAVIEAMVAALAAPPADPGRSGCGADPRTACRSVLAALLGVDDPLRVVLLPSATHALNLAVDALLPAESHAVTTMLEHNSVLRPLAHLRIRRGVTVTYVPPRDGGRVNPGDVAAAIRRPATRLLVVTHGANATGSIQPVEEIAEVAARAGVALLVDASQTTGAVPLDHRGLPGRVYVAFAGHKGLLGPSGVGGLVVPDAKTPQTLVGGTGVRSESELHPEELPLRHEAGTPNLPGIAGLEAGVRVVLERGVEVEGAHRHALVWRLRGLLASVGGVTLVPLAGGDGRAGIVAFTLAGWTVDEVGFVLRESFGIQTRSGLHCAPLAHRWLGTAPLGTVRASFGPSNTAEDADALAGALAALGPRPR